jgi:hypothetical protein
LVPRQHNPIAVCTTRENDRRRRSRAVPGHSIRVRGCAAVGPAAMHEWFSPFMYGRGPHLCSCSCAAAKAGLLLRLPRTTRPSAQAGPPRPRYPVLVPDPIPAQKKHPEFTQKKHPPRLRMLFLVHGWWLPVCACMARMCVLSYGFYSSLASLLYTPSVSMYTRVRVYLCGVCDAPVPPTH